MTRIVAVTLALALYAGTAPARETADLGRALDTYLGRLERLGFTGTVLVAKDGKVVLERGYGLADRDRKIPMAADSVISIGSITKQFTAAAILKLEMRGKLRVEDTIARFWPDAPADKAGITLHQLLTHTAGLRSDYGPTDYEVVTRDAYVGRVLAAPLDMPPGRGHRYSNAGYSLLAAIVELVSGQSYERFLRESLFEPAGMRQTGYRVASWRDGQVARGYVDGRDWGTISEKLADEKLPYWNLVGNGGVHSTAGDMYRWHLALEGEAVLSKQAKTKFVTPYVVEGPEGDSHYAYGWAIFTTPRKTRLVAHNGGNGVFAADFRRYVDENVVIYAASTSEPTAIALTEALPAVVFGMPYATPPEVARVEAAALDRLAGAYAVEGGGRLVVRREGDRLSVSGEGREAMRLLFAAPPAEVAARLDARVSAIVEGASKGDARPVAEAFGGQVPLEEVAAREAGMWRQWTERNGAFKGFEVLGTYRMRPMAASFARLDFERGSVIVRYGWAGPELAGIRVVPSLPSVAIYPTSATQFTTFDLRDPEPAVVRFEADGRLTIGRGGSRVDARRERV